MYNLRKYLQNIDGVFHFAALARIQPSITLPRRAIDSNIIRNNEYFGINEKFKNKEYSLFGFI